MQTEVILKTWNIVIANLSENKHVLYVRILQQTVAMLRPELNHVVDKNICSCGFVIWSLFRITSQYTLVIHIYELTFCNQQILLKRSKSYFVLVTSLVLLFWKEEKCLRSNSTQRYFQLVDSLFYKLKSRRIVYIKMVSKFPLFKNNTGLRIYINICTIISKQWNLFSGF